MSAVQPLSIAAEPVSLRPALCETPDPRGLGGLLASSSAGPSALPLRSCSVRAEVVGVLSRTTVTQVYDNPLEQAVEAVHIFPLPDRGAVVSVELRAGEVRVVAECQERKQAEATFAKARAQGHRAALLTQEREDVHTLRVTNLPPKSQVTVEVVVEEALEVVDGEVRWRFPTTIAPRYTPGDALGQLGPGVSPDTDIVPDASRLTPPLRLSGGTTLDLEVCVRGKVRRVESSLHAVSVGLDDGAVRVRPSGRATLDRDFALAIVSGDASESGVRAWTDGTYTAVVVEPPVVVAPAALPRDAVFVVDISGSMQGRKMAAAKLALKTALHGLMPQDRFLLIAFDNRVEHFRAGFSPVDDAHIQAADRWIDALRARGGTVMAPALEAALKPAAVSGRQRTVLFVTDGQSTDEARLLQLLWRHRGEARLFPLGIDTAVNSALLRRLARVGGGVCELTTPSADIEEVVARLESRFGTPVVDGIRVEGAIPVRNPLPALFSGRPITFLVEGGAGGLTVKGTSAVGQWSVAVQPGKAPFSLGAAWARARVSALEDRLIVHPFEEEALQPEILRVALAHGVASRWTAFVAVDRSVKVDGLPLEIVQPVELPDQWSEDFRAVPAVAKAMMAAPMATGAMLPPSPIPTTRAPAREKSRRRRSGGLGNMLRSMLSREDKPAPPMEVADEAMAACEPAPMVEGYGGAPGGGGAFDRDADDSAVQFFSLSEEEAEEAPMPAAPPAPKRRPAPRAMGVRSESKKKSEKGSSAGQLARSQSADGSFGGDVARTIVAMLQLVKDGHTRRRGVRTRVVVKAAIWLEQRPGEPGVALALAILADVEQGRDITADRWQALVDLLGGVARPLLD